MTAKGRPLVLVLSNDLSLAAAKTSRQLVRALERIGIQAIGRDTQLIRWAAGKVENESASRREAYEMAVVAKWNKFVFDYGIDAVISLDLHWLFSSQLFLGDDQVKQIHSIWFDDLRSHFLTASMFPLHGVSALKLIGNPKVTHHAYGASQAEELCLLGLKQVRRSHLAAGEEFLRHEEPCVRVDRLAFIGNPGIATPPASAALAAMDRGENLAALRRLAREEILAGLASEEPSASWLRENVQVRDLLAAAMEQRVSRPETAAISLLVEAGAAFPGALEYLNRRGFLLDAALLVKLVNRYDRPALIRRFWMRGELDVFGSPEQWSPYGIIAHPHVPFAQLGAVYRRYAAHLNAPNCARDATANEKLFEIAACGRVSLNLASPDVGACYGDDEIVLAQSEEELDEAARRILRDPGEALAKGAAARRRTEREHLWEHRLREVIT